MKRVAYGFRDKRLFQWESPPLASSNKQLPVSCVISFSFHRHGTTLRAEEFEHLIDLVEAERGLALFQFTHEAQTHSGFLGEVYLCQFIFLRISFTYCAMIVPTTILCINSLKSRTLKIYSKCRFRVHIQNIPQTQLTSRMFFYTLSVAI